MSEFLVKMDTPNRCCDCPMCYDYILCRLAGKEFGEIECVEIVADWCPLIKIPPHGRLIDANEISEHKYATLPPYRKEYADGKPKSEDEVIAFKFGWNNAIDAITENAPTIIPAEEGE